MRRRARALCAGVTILLVACGGGGGGDSGPANSPSPAPPTAANPGTFTLSINSLSFTGQQSATPPPSQSATVSITGTNVAKLGAAYVGGQTQPAWLNVNITGSGTQYTLTVSVVTGTLAPGSYSTTFQVGTADAANNILAHQDFTVSLTVQPAAAPPTPIAIQTPSVAATYIFGDVQPTQIVSVSVKASDRLWTLSADAAWIHVPNTTQSGDAAPGIVLDATGLAPGTYNGHVIATNSSDSSDTASLSVALTVTPAALSVAETSYLFGGNDGRATLTPLPIHLSLSTGGATYPYTITVSADSGGNWLSVDSPSGIVGSGGTSVNLRVDPAVVRQGSFTGHIQVSATVEGTTFQEVRPVTFNLEANRLVVSASGVGLSQIAGRSVLSRTLQVFSGLGRTDTPWTATSDSSWLTVTPAGMTGGDLVLTANPAGQPLDATQFANVTITSTDAAVANQQTVRVGLFVSNTATVDTSLNLLVPSNVISMVTELSSSPVEPIVAVGIGLTDVSIYDINTGQLLRTLANAAAVISDLKFSEDGRSVFVLDSMNQRVNQLDAVTGSILQSYDSTTATSNGYALAVMHPNGNPMVVTSSGRMYDLTQGTSYSVTLDSLFGIVALAGSPDQSLLADERGDVYRLTRSTLGGDTLTAQDVPVQRLLGQGAAGQTCFSVDGAYLYMANAGAVDFTKLSVTTDQFVQPLALAGYPGSYPESILCLWNGVIVGGVVNDVTAPYDIYLYDGSTGVLQQQLSSSGVLRSGLGGPPQLARGLAVSPDETRMLSVWKNGVSYWGMSFTTLP